MSWSYVQMATINRLKGPVPIKTLMSSISSSFHFALTISSVLTVDQRLLTHLTKCESRLSSEAPESPSLPTRFEEPREEVSHLSPLWAISRALVPSLTSLHSTVGSKL